jgi:zinc protease
MSMSVSSAGLAAPALKKSQGSAQGSTASRIRLVTSPKGVTAWLVEDYTVPLVAIEAAFTDGTTLESDAEAGALTMLAELLGEGAGPHDSMAYQERLEEKAIEFSASARSDAFRMSMRTLSRHLDEAFELAALAINEPRLDADAVERVRAQIVSGIRRDEFDPDSMAARHWFARAFPGHPYGREDRGALASVGGLTRTAILGLKTRAFTRSGLRVAAVGAIDEATLARALDRAFGDLPAGQAAPAATILAPRGLGERHVIDLDVPQSTIRFGLAGPLRKDADFMPKFVINHILGGGVFQARLFKEVREKRGLAYSVSSSLYPMKQAGLLFGGTSTKNERAMESLGVIEDEIAKLAENGPDEAELAKAKSYLTGSYALRFDTSSKIAGQLAQLQLEDFGPDYPDRRNAEVEAVGLAEAKAAARALLGDGKMLVTIVGRPAGA